MARIDSNSPLVTTTGAKVELVETSGRRDFPLIGYIDAAMEPSRWTRRGFVNLDETPHANDLSNVPPEPQKTTRYISWLGGNLFSLHETRDLAIGANVLSVVKARFVEGQFDP